MTLPELARKHLRPQFRNAKTELSEVIESHARREPARQRARKRLREAGVVDATGTGRGKVFVRVEDLRAAGVR